MKKISGILAVKVLNKTLYYNLDNVLYCENNIILNDVEGSSFWMKKNLFYYHDNEGYHNLLNIDNGLLYHGEIAFMLNTLNNNEMICSHNHQFINGFWEREIGVFDLSQMKIIKETNLKNIYFFFTTSKYYLCRHLNDRKLFYRIDHDFNIVWQFSVADFPPYINGFFREQEADIKQIVGVYNNILWVYIGGWHLIGLDINTGEKVHHIEDILSLLSLNREERLDVNLDDTIHLNEKEGVLKAFAHRYYFEIDLNTLSGKVKKDFGPNWNPDWRIRYSTYYQEYPNLLFFCGYNKEIHFPNAFGIFNTEKAEIVWYDTTKDDLGYFYNPPQANDKLLAVLDDKHNLLIYERDAMK